MRCVTQLSEICPPIGATRSAITGPSEGRANPGLVDATVVSVRKPLRKDRGRRLEMTTAFGRISTPRLRTSTAIVALDEHGARARYQHHEHGSSGYCPGVRVADLLSEEGDCQNEYEQGRDEDDPRFHGQHLLIRGLVVHANWPRRGYLGGVRDGLT
ncbi:MAG: hypothetical protein K0S37_4404 [Microbacterium sp.]|nr:hypothetical protein [Microbacterium sp.]